MWYIVEAEEGAGIYLGFNRDVTKEEFERAIKENRLTELLRGQSGRVLFYPLGNDPRHRERLSYLRDTAKQQPDLSRIRLRSRTGITYRKSLGGDEP